MAYDGNDAVTYDNGTWSAPISGLGAEDENNAVSCPTTTFCMAVENNDAITYDDGTWSTPASIDPYGTFLWYSVSCPTTTFCVAVDDDTQSFTYDDGTWSDTGGGPGGPFDSPLSCPTTTFCMAVDFDGADTDVDGTWSPPTNVIDSGNVLQAVSCPTTTFCVAVDGVGNALTYEAPLSPVVTENATPGTTSATVNGTVNPNGSPVTSCTFEYGATTAYASSEPCAQSVGSGTTPVSVSADLSGLTPNTTYHYQLEATLSTGAAYGGDQDFLTNSIPSPYITSYTLPPPIVGQRYAATLTASGGTAPYTWELLSALPKGLRLDDKTGVISGKAANPGTKKSFPYVDVEVTDSSSPPQTASSLVELSPVSPLFVTASPIETSVGQTVSGDVGYFTYSYPSGSPPSASAFSATIDWGDGTTDPGTITSLSTNDETGSPATYEISIEAPHTYLRITGVPGHTYQHITKKPLIMTITVAGPGGASASDNASVNIESPHPTAYFAASPNNPAPYNLALLMPRSAGPGQDPITSYQWTFSGQYEPVTWDAQTLPDYQAVISNLVANPGNSGAVSAATALGMLPIDGGLNSNQVSEVAQAWQAYFVNYGVVPIMFDFTGHLGIRLTTTDASGATSKYTSTITVPNSCPPWGGPVANWFGDLTTCETWNGITAQFGPHRRADFYELDIPDADEFDLGLGPNVSVTVDVTAGNNLFLGISAGVGISTPYPNGAMGWVGPPGTQYSPSEKTIDHFLQGNVIDAGFNLGVGFTSVYSPSTNEAGEEIGGFNIGASAGFACSVPMPPSAAATQLASQLYSQYGGTTLPSTSAAATIVNAIIAAVGGYSMLGQLFAQAIGFCMP
jgi:hypothetical protein